MLTRTAICAAALLLCQPHAAFAQDKAPVSREAQDLAGRLDATIAPYFQPDAPGAAILVVKDGKTVLRRAYGMADTAKGVKMSPDMVLRIGSMTKQFTATAILLLADEGKLALSDPNTNYLPGYPTQGKTITIEHLLTHTSGIVSYTGKPGFPQQAPQDITVAAQIDSFKNDPLQFEPGSTWRYNNSGYYLLGAIIEKVSGQPYHAFLEQRIFLPLGMSHTAYEGHERSKWPSAAGHSLAANGFGPARQLGKNQSYAAGELVSTVDDLAKWEATIAGKKLLKPATWQRAFTSYRLLDGKDSNYGYGWEMTLIQGEPTIGHSGSTRGFRSYGLRLPAKGVYVAVLTNSDSGTVVPDVVARRAAAVAIGKPLPEFREVALSAAALDAVAGEYTLDKDVKRVFRRDGEYLSMQRSGRGPLLLKALSANTFFVPDTVDWFVFQVDAAGKATGVTYNQDGRALVHLRSGEAPPPRIVAKIPVAAFDAHLGRYEMQPGMVMEIIREGSRYFVQPNGQRRLEIFPLSESRFFARDVDAEISFDDQGLTFKQGARSHLGRKI
ncbi:serine hydrolase [Massilia yuzhufengensis]|uniref:CubicO group peptidase, beta-lactamase class C family n=1 Tax=Massilia yuzhufengensis TaxID=1164594 RepID=A0A1I1DD60_9BURK|nr:serine hydrolase [Massilia yuzhufengensis]SFB72777.1 CubicO group peptidase, beta-lactamase class C family [Massilia yuzhufengensis]